MARLDLHVHSTASDGEHAPAEVVRRAAEGGLETIALTDHDTLGGVEEAREAGAGLGMRVIAGCEFSVAGPGGEMHLLAYFLPPDDPALDRFLLDQRAKRVARAQEMIRRLQHSGVAVTEQGVSAAAGGGAWGRPHVARAMMAVGAVQDVQEAFDRFIGFGRPAFVPKALPAVREVTGLVRAVAGVTSAAHLKDRGVRPVLRELQKAGVDAVEVLHPSHDETTVRRIGALAAELELLQTGGTDWHGDVPADRSPVPLGAMPVPDAWLAALQALHAARGAAISGKR
ncbi:MAG: PHP domain-containing protein [Gemmatimonadetes bacterium]|nr:PHP domain-containing protein [Gemmatimonadota bacterium]